MTDPAPDSALDRLNASERDLLMLLGQGHTAKSIAALKGLSELAVNERFRSARRKTGIGSSREIARLLVARENRDDIIGVAEPTPPVAPLPRPGALRRASPLRRWSLLMSAAAVLIASAILAQQTAVPPASTDRPVAVSAAMAAAIFADRTPSPDVVALHDEIARDPADPAWSAATEAALSEAYHAVLDPTAAVEAFDVTCTASLCEVLGVSRPNLSRDENNALMEGFQAQEIHRLSTRLDVELVIQSFNQTRDDAAPGNSPKVVFVAYWRRDAN